jgi:hypothetical protein
MPAITLDGQTAVATSPEGVQTSMPLGNLIDRLAPASLDTGELVLPDGVKCVKTRGPVTVLAHETPPRVFNFKWIAADSPAPFGPDAHYRIARIALPYLITIAVYHSVRGRLTLSNSNECFFLSEPLRSLDGPELMYPALLNCSRFRPPEGKPLSWICSQKLNRTAFERERDTNARLRAAFRELMRTLLDTGFNLSSEHHEGASWFSETRRKRVDPRIETIEKWEAATVEDPLFPLEVPWLKTGLTARQVIERIFQNLRARSHTVHSAADIARIVFNHKPSEMDRH